MIPSPSRTLMCIFYKDIFYITYTRTTEFKIFTSVHYHHLIFRLYPSVASYLSKVKDPVQNHVLDSVVMSLWSPSIWNASLVFPRLSWSWKASYCRMSFSVGLSDASLLDSGLVGISKKQFWGWKITSLPSLVQCLEAFEINWQKTD